MACSSFSGGSITFDSSFFTEIRSVQHTGQSRGFASCSHAATTGGLSKYPHAFWDNGQLVVEVYLRPGVEPAIGDAVSAFTLTYPLLTGQSSAATMAGNCFISSIESSSPHDDAMTATYTLEITGNLTYTPPS